MGEQEKADAVLRKALGADLAKLIEQPPCRCCGGKLRLTEIAPNDDGMFRRGDVLVDVYVECQGCHGKWELRLSYDSVVTVPGRGTTARKVEG